MKLLDKKINETMMALYQKRKNDFIQKYFKQLTGEEYRLGQEKKMKRLVRKHQLRIVVVDSCNALAIYRNHKRLTNWFNWVTDTEEAEIKDE